MPAKTPREVAAVERLKRWATVGEGRLVFMWETPGAWRRCMAFYKDKVPARMRKGWCAELHHRATGLWPTEGNHHGKKRRKRR